MPHRWNIFSCLSTSVSPASWSEFWFSSTTASPTSFSTGRGGANSFSVVGLSSIVTSRLELFTTRPERVVVAVVVAAVVKLAAAVSMVGSYFVMSEADFLGLPLLRLTGTGSLEVSLNCWQRVSASGMHRLAAACWTLSRLWGSNFSSPV